jgi:PAS domain S-box-containing protein
MREFAETDGQSVLADVVDDFSDAVIVRDADSGAVVAVNDAVEALFGHEPSTFGELDADAYAANPAVAASARSAARQTARENGRATFRWEAKRRDGTTFPAESNVSTTTVGDRACFASLVRDVSDRRRRERDLERFAAVLSHDLRSPLNAARAQVDILRREIGDGEEFLDRLDRVHERMTDIVEDVRTLLEDGRRVVDPDRVDLDRLIEDVWEAVGGAQDPTATLVVPDDLGTAVADEGRLCRTCENLFENAIRHSDGPVTVTVSVRSTGDTLVIEDDGPGIAAAERERIFEYGYTTAEDGTGLGLSIVAAAADAHGWDVAVGDSDSGGVRFEITGMRIETESSE